jgi:hypothetical protein
MFVTQRGSWELEGTPLRFFLVIRVAGVECVNSVIFAGNSGISVYTVCAIWPILRKTAQNRCRNSLYDKFVQVMDDLS